MEKNNMKQKIKMLIVALACIAMFLVPLNQATTPSPKYIYITVNPTHTNNGKETGFISAGDGGVCDIGPEVDPYQKVIGIDSRAFVYQNHTQITVTASPNIGFYFVNWTITKTADGTSVTGNVNGSSLVIQDVTTDLTITAYFMLPRTIAVVPNELVASFLSAPIVVDAVQSLQVATAPDGSLAESVQNLILAQAMAK
jgi:hypothetical protein